MTKATLDKTLYTLQRAADYIRITRRRIDITGTRWILPAADITAIAILDSAAKQVLGVRQ